MRRSPRTHMKHTLTLKSISKNIPTQDSPALPIEIQGGRKPKKGKACTALLNQLTEFINSDSKVFIQMRNGVGYRGLPIMLEDGWLTLQEAEIFGTKQNKCVAELLIQVKDGSYIAHVHFAECQEPSKQFDAGLGEL